MNFREYFPGYKVFQQETADNILGVIWTPF